jgi:hypothetical protein
VSNNEGKKFLVGMVTGYNTFQGWHALVVSAIQGPGLLLKQGLIRCCECKGIKRRQCDEMGRGIRQCAETVKLLIFKPAAHAILT